MSTRQTALKPNEVEGVNSEDRRFNARNRMVKDVIVLSLDSSQPKAEGTVLDLSRDGVYFTTACSYQVGTPLILQFSGVRSECLCEVTRIEQLPQGRFGIGVRILSW